VTISSDCVVIPFFILSCSSDRVIKKLKGHMLDREYIDKNGFKSPIIIKDKAGLDLKVPDPSFTVDDVEVAVGKSFHGMLGKGSQSSFCFRKSTLFIV